MKTWSGSRASRCRPLEHDAVLWLSGSAYDIIFDVSHRAIAELKGLASVAEETS